MYEDTFHRCTLQNMVTTLDSSNSEKKNSVVLLSMNNMQKM